jgi:hypothetical protein
MTETSCGSCLCSKHLVATGSGRARLRKGSISCLRARSVDLLQKIEEIWLAGKTFDRQGNIGIQDQRARRDSASLVASAAALKGIKVARRCEGLFRSEVNFFRHVPESDLIMSENVVSPENVSGSSSGEKSYAAGELIGVGLQLDAHF